jgi:predicted nucleotidyltransferase
MVVDEKLLHEVIKRVLEVVQPDRIILFGSAASGTMTRDSDIDLLILEASPQPDDTKRTRVRDNLRGLGVPFDIIVMSMERFEETKDLIGGIAYPANRYGRVIYEAA